MKGLRTNRAGKGLDDITKGVTKIGSTLFNKNASDKIKADTLEFDRLGFINHNGTILKWADHKFHKRYMVLRGFDLYWYRDEDRSVKGMVTLPSTEITKKDYGGTELPVH